MTWSASQGLVSYINGIIVGIASYPTTSLATRAGPTSGHFVLGKSSTEENGNSHPKFQITTFSVLKTFISKSESFRMFFYYIGRTSNAIEGKINLKKAYQFCKERLRRGNIHF